MNIKISVWFTQPKQNILICELHFDDNKRMGKELHIDMNEQNKTAFYILGTTILMINCYLKKDKFMALFMGMDIFY